VVGYDKPSKPFTGMLLRIDDVARLPQYFCSHINLIALQDKNKISGTIPKRMLMDMTSLQVLNLRQNELTGTLPVELEYPSGLKTLDLSTNVFIGAIPTQLGTLVSLRKSSVDRMPSYLRNDSLTLLLSLASENLELTDTFITGAMPPEVCEARVSGSLERVTADCDGVECECCDNCAAPQAG
jgi:hypothetical protein